MISKNNVTAPDDYTNAAEIRLASIARVNFQISNQAIYYQLGDPADPAGPVRWLPEVFLKPGYFSLERRTIGVRFRAAIPAASVPAGSQQAQVTVDALTLQEVGGG